MSKERKPVATAGIGITKPESERSATALDNAKVRLDSIHSDSHLDNLVRSAANSTGSTVSGSAVAANQETYRSGPSTLKSNELIREVASRFIDFSKQE